MEFGAPVSFLAPRDPSSPRVRPFDWVVLNTAERSLLIMLIGFALSVIGTRWFLALTGFPKIGGGDLHIAHALWGGALLFVGALLPMVWAGRRVHDVAAASVGVGMGLFIDEVGKFITTRNDYFYPAAAPIIYSTFLLATVLFLWVRRRRHASEPTARGHLSTNGAAEAWGSWWEGRRGHWLGARGLRSVTIVALVLAGLGSMLALTLLIFAAVFIIPPSDLPLLTLVLMHVGVDGISGVLMLIGAGALIARRTAFGASAAVAGLLLALTVADVLSFYLRQFDSILVVLFHLGLLLAVKSTAIDSPRIPERL
jgi:hypothetical protein